MMIDFTRKKTFRAGEKILLVLFFALIFVFTLYISGNFQSFLDSTQLMLLELLVFVSLSVSFLSFLYGCVILVSGAGRRAELNGKFFFFIISLASGVTVFFFSRLILAWTA